VYEHQVVMRTNIELDDVIVKEAMSLTKLRTKKDGKLRFRSIDKEN
jgi:Arc/MetJ family transcription regulator